MDAARYNPHSLTLRVYNMSYSKKAIIKSMGITAGTMAEEAASFRKSARGENTSEKMQRLFNQRADELRESIEGVNTAIQHLLGYTDIEAWLESKDYENYQNAYYAAWIDAEKERELKISELLAA